VVRLECKSKCLIWTYRGGSQFELRTLQRFVVVVFRFRFRDMVGQKNAPPSPPQPKDIHVKSLEPVMLSYLGKGSLKCN